MRARGHHQRRIVARREALGRHVAEAARRIIHRPDGRARIGELDMAPRGVAPAPPVVFRPHHAFLRHVIGICPLQSARHKGGMDVDHQPVLGGSGEQPVVEGHHFLVLPVEVIDLDAGDAEPLVQCQRGVHLPVQRLPVDPQPDAHAALAREADQFGHIHAVGRTGDVSDRVLRFTRLASPRPAAIDHVEG